MRSTLSGVFAAALLAAAPAAAETNQFFSNYFDKLGVVCYARRYDAQHLAQHPRQKVQQIGLYFTSAAKHTPAAFEVGLAIVARGTGRSFSSPATCAERGDAIVCNVESDGGTFQLRPRGSGMTLQVVGDGLRMEGSTFFEAGGTRSDDNLFVLTPSAVSLCAAAQRS